MGSIDDVSKAGLIINGEGLKEVLHADAGLEYGGRRRTRFERIQRGRELSCIHRSNFSERRNDMWFAPVAVNQRRHLRAAARFEDRDSPAGQRRAERL